MPKRSCRAIISQAFRSPRTGGSLRPHQPGYPLRHPSRGAGARIHDRREPGHRFHGHRAGRCEGHPPPPSHRKAAHCGRARDAQGPHHLQGYSEAAGLPRRGDRRPGALLVAAAIGVGSDLDTRLELLLDAGVDAFAVDTAHGHSANVLQAIRRAKMIAPQVLVLAGNVVTAEGTNAPSTQGADAVKVESRRGALCTTRRCGRGRATDFCDCRVRLRAQPRWRSSRTAASSIPATS